MLAKVMSAVAGLGARPVEGEITLTHRGILFLDEFPEFSRMMLESLRQPIEDALVSISRANGKTTFPAKCMLIATQNPCQCEYLGDNTHEYTCAPHQILRCQKKVSGPLLDRIDIHIDVPTVKVEKLTEKESAEVEDSRTIRTRGQNARNRQQKRFAGTKITANAELNNKTIKKLCTLSDECISLLRMAVFHNELVWESILSYDKSCTYHCLADADTIKPEHLAEALQYRPKNKQ